MRRWIWMVGLLVIGTGWSALVLSAQDVSGFRELMQEANQMNGSLKLNIEGHYGEDAIADAVKLQELFGKMADFFEKNSSQAAEYARSAVAGFKRVEDLVSAGDTKQAMAVYYETRANCSNCHDSHRNRGASGEYQIIF